MEDEGRGGRAVDRKGLLMVRIDGESRQHTLVMELAAGSGTFDKQASKGTHRALQQRQNERNAEGKNMAETEKETKRERKGK
jgi:hypothetical protein